MRQECRESAQERRITLYKKKSTHLVCDTREWNWESEECQMILPCDHRDLTELYHSGQPNSEEVLDPPAFSVLFSTTTVHSPMDNFLIILCSVPVHTSQWFTHQSEGSRAFCTRHFVQPPQRSTHQ